MKPYVICSSFTPEFSHHAMTLEPSDTVKILHPSQQSSSQENREFNPGQLKKVVFYFWHKLGSQVGIMGTRDTVHFDPYTQKETVFYTLP